MIPVACLHLRRATVNTDNLSHVHADDGGTKMTQTIYTVVQELTYVAVFFQENVVIHQVECLAEIDKDSSY